MPTYKLYYFNAKGIAEVSRLLFATAGVNYEDVRIEAADWPKEKEKMPMGAMPVLEVDGTKISQSLAIDRFLAREFGLYGKSNMEAASIDMVCETVSDFFQAYYPSVYGKDEAVMAEKKKTFIEFLPLYMKKMEHCLKQNGDGNGFFVGSNITMADLSFLRSLDVFDKSKLELTGPLKELRARIEAVPEIGAYLKSRPETDN